MESRSERGAATVFAAAVSVVALLIATLAVVASNSESSTTAVQTTKAEIILKDTAIRPNPIVLSSGNAELTVRNDGSVAHNLVIGDAKTAEIDAGKFAMLSLHGLAPGTYRAVCTIPGHEAAGMVAVVQVGGASAPGAASAAGAASPQASTGGAAAPATIDFEAAPPAGWKPFDPAVRPAPGGTEHKLTLRATEKVLEVAPGVKQELWTFDDQVPGPMLRGKVGDLFTVTLRNDGAVGHSIDFHASRVAWNDEMRTIKSGESLVYQYRAEFAGIFMYHCGTAPALHHIGNGMYGAIIIDPPDLGRVDREYVFVQSELYLGPMGAPGDLKKMQSESWDAVVFNGYVNQYRHSPIRVEPNERVRVWVLDAGPSENSAFHVVGTVFDTVFKEGTYLLRPDQRRGGAQVLDLQPAQGGFVEMSFAEPGLYPIVTHKFANVGKGALGLFQAGTVAGAPGGGH